MSAQFVTHHFSLYVVISFKSFIYCTNKNGRKTLPYGDIFWISGYFWLIVRYEN